MVPRPDRRLRRGDPAAVDCDGGRRTATTVWRPWREVRHDPLDSGRNERVAATLTQFRAAYLSRDVDAMVALFADDAELVAAPGLFRGKDEVRRFLAWAAELSPSIALDDEGLIRRYRSHYDKLAVIQQVAVGLPGVGGWFTKQIVDVVVAAGSLGLEA